MERFKHLNILALLTIATLFTACEEKKGSATSTAPALSVVDEVQPAQEVEQEEESPEVALVKEALLYQQDFEAFDLQGSWYLTDFGIYDDSAKEDYISDNQLKFDIAWTKRTRNHLADLYQVDRKEMTKEKANDLCTPKIEIGKEKVYGNSTSNDLIAELDSDLKHCDISGTEPAAIRIRSFVPTEIGYKYRLDVDYKMRSYSAQTKKSYKDLVVRFGSKLEKFDPVFEEFTTASVEIVAQRKSSKLVLRDNGLPDSYGVLIDDIKVTKLGKVENYDQCAKLFNLKSKGFKKCVQGEVDTNEVCDFKDASELHVNYKPGAGVVQSRMNTNNALLVEDTIQGKINFLSLGLKGKLVLACKVGAHKGLYDIYGKTLKLNEISWGNATPESYPELAKVRVKLEGCDDDSLNRVVTVGSVQTKENFSYTFDEDPEGKSYAGCMMNKLIIRDITPTGPSADGFDVNSIQFLD